MYTLRDEQGSPSKLYPWIPMTRGTSLDATGNATLAKTITVSKPVEQLGFLKDIDSLVVLSGTFVLPL